MTSMLHIAPAFIKAKKAFGPALKDKSNPHFRSKYADLGTCLEAVDDALLDNGIAVYQETFLDDNGVTVETIFLHESGETIRSGKLHVPASKNDPQGYGSALTYCRRYSLMAACGIAPEDDDGNAASQCQVPKAQKREQVSIAALMSAMEACTTLDSLKVTFAQAWKESEHALEVKQSYDALKAKFDQQQEKSE